MANFGMEKILKKQRINLRIIKIIGFQKYKGGTRVSMLAGRQAYEDYAKKDIAVHGISTLLSSKPYEIKAAAEKLMNERNEIKEQLVSAKRKIAAKADEIERYVWNGLK